MTIGKDEKVIKVIVNRAGFEYDIHALVKSFYPGWDVQIKEEDEPVLEPGTADILIWIREEEVQIALAEPEKEEQPFVMGSRELFRDDTGKATRLEIKNRIKQLLYQMLSEHTGKRLPWGTLTGIRPVKIPMSMLEEGKGEEEIRDYMRTARPLTVEEKADIIDGGCRPIADKYAALSKPFSCSRFAQRKKS